MTVRTTSRTVTFAHPCAVQIRSVALRATQYFQPSRKGSHPAIRPFPRHASFAVSPLRHRFARLCVSAAYEGTDTELSRVYYGRLPVSRREHSGSSGGARTAPTSPPRSRVAVG
jgi:hypothetical protein